MTSLKIKVQLNEAGGERLLCGSSCGDSDDEGNTNLMKWAILSAQFSPSIVYIAFPARASNSLPHRPFLFSYVHQTHKKRERLKTAGTIDGLVQGLDEEGYVPAPKKRFNS